MTVIIRILQSEDFSSWKELWRAYLQFYKTSLSDEVTQMTWNRILDPDLDIHGLCAETESRSMIGIVHFLYHPVTWSISPRCYLEDLYVRDKVRGQGAGRALIEAVYDAARTRQADQVYWLTETDNLVARNLYDRVGELTSFIKYKEK